MTSTPHGIHPVFAIPEWLPHLGGLATFYAHLARCRSQLGLPTTILTTQRKPENPGWPGLEVVCVEGDKNRRFVQLSQALPEDWKLASLSLATGGAMRAWLREHAPEGAVVFAAEFLGYASSLCETGLPPLVVTAHGSLGQIAARSPADAGASDLPLVRMLESDALLRAHLAHAYSPANAREWTATLGHDIPCIDPPFALSQLSDTPKSANQPLTGVVLGRLQDWKGAQTLAAALARLGPDFPLRIDWLGTDTRTAPGGTSMSEWLQKKHPTIWGKTFCWHGPAPREEALRRQAAADFALVPSRWDTLNFTVLEAMDAGVPVLVSSGTGASYLIEENINGRVFPADDPEALATVLREVTAHPETLPALGERARSFLHERFTPSGCVERYEELTRRAQAAAQKQTLPSEGAANALQMLTEALSQTDALPRRSGRELARALSQKAGERLGIRRKP